MNISVGTLNVKQLIESTTLSNFYIIEKSDKFGYLYIRRKGGNLFVTFEKINLSPLLFLGLGFYHGDGNKGVRKSINEYYFNSPSDHILHGKSSRFGFDTKGEPEVVNFFESWRKIIFPKISLTISSKLNHKHWCDLGKEKILLKEINFFNEINTLPFKIEYLSGNRIKFLPRCNTLKFTIDEIEGMKRIRQNEFIIGSLIKPEPLEFRVNAQGNRFKYKRAYRTGDKAAPYAFRKKPEAGFTFQIMYEDGTSIMIFFLYFLRQICSVLVGESDVKNLNWWNAKKLVNEPLGKFNIKKFVKDIGYEIKEETDNEIRISKKRGRETILLYKEIDLSLKSFYQLGAFLAECDVKGSKINNTDIWLMNLVLDFINGLSPHLTEIVAGKRIKIAKSRAGDVTYITQCQEYWDEKLPLLKKIEWKSPDDSGKNRLPTLNSLEIILRGTIDIFVRNLISFVFKHPDIFSEKYIMPLKFNQNLSQV
jgi:hypothetical protein